MLLDLDNKSDTWTCDICPATFVRKDLWQRHQRVRHTDSNSTSTPPQDGALLQDGSRSESAIATEESLDTPQPGSPRPGPTTYHSEVGEDSWDVQDPGYSDSAAEFSLWQEWLIEDQPRTEVEFGADLPWLFGSAETGASPQTYDNGSHGPTPPSKVSGPVDSIPEGSSENAAEVTSEVSFDLLAPTCAFRVCKSLTRVHRQQLLEMLSSDLAHLEPRALTVESLLQGVHLFCRFVSKEYPIVHSYHLIPPITFRDTLSTHFGLESPPELLWAVITLGWTVLDRRKYGVYHDIGRKIQTILRQRIIAVRFHSLTNSPLLQAASLTDHFHCTS